MARTILTIEVMPAVSALIESCGKQQRTMRACAGISPVASGYSSRLRSDDRSQKNSRADRASRSRSRVAIEIALRVRDQMLIDMQRWRIASAERMRDVITARAGERRA